MEDREYIRKIQNGHTEYLNDIAEKYYDDIYRFCCYQTGNPQDSYDLAQETFLKFIRYAERYRDRNLKGYLLTIARNLCFDYFRRRGRIQAAYMDGRESGQLPDSESICIARQEGPSAETAMVLLEALNRLPFAQREAVVLYYIYDLKQREIAGITGSSAAAVKSRIHQAKEKLREWLKEEDFYG